MRLPRIIAALCMGTLLLFVPVSPAAAGEFHVRCEFSHRAQDDPIVHPGMAGMSHWHDFFGAKDATADSTYESMLAGGSTCSDRMDTAGYWHPRVRIGGRARRALLVAYYSRNGKPDVRPFPKDLKVVAGSAMATGRQSKRVVYWRCIDRGARKKYTYVPHCRAGERLTANIVFPDCWNGTQLDSADHKAHMAYATRGRCPSTHRTMLPRLVLTIVFRARARNSADVELASGPFYTLHADFWNTWRQARLRRLTNQCLNINVNCGLIERAAS